MNDALRTLTARLRQAAASGAPDPDALRDIHAGFGRALAEREAEGASPAEIRAAVEPARALYAESPFVRRLQTWPRGYMGDFETIDHLLERPAPSASPLGRAIETLALDAPIAEQHRRKVDAQRQAIEACATAPGPEARILLIAAGSAPDAGAALPALERAGCTLVLNDIEEDALARAARRLAPIARQVALVPGNALRKAAVLARRGPFDLVLCGGLFDYLPDRVARALLRQVFGRLLAPDGQLLFTNILAGNPHRPIIEHLADWRLIERSEAALEALVRGAAASAHVEVRQDATGLTGLVYAARTERALHAIAA